MKKYFPFFAIIFCYILFSGCTIKKDLTFSVTKTYTVNSYQSTTYTSISDILASDAGSDFEKFKGDLESVELLSIKYEALYVPTTVTNTQNVSATIKVCNLQDQNITDLAIAPVINLKSLYKNEQNATLNSTGCTAINNLLLHSPNSARIYFFAVTNETPFTATFQFVFNFKATYKKSIL
jgi:hypothetical protein